MDDFLSQIDSVLKSQNPQQQDQVQPAKQEPVENDFIGNIDKVLKSQPTQADRLDAAEQWAAQRRGSEKVLGGVGVRDILENSLPFVSAGIKFKKNKDYMEAKKAFDEGRATDEQLGKIAEFNYDQQRTASKTGVGSKILGAAVATPAMLGEAYMATPVTGAVGSALGLGRVAGVGAGQFAINAAKAGAQQSLAAPMMPSMWLNESQQRQMKNGGEWYSPENIAAPLLHSAISNALLGQISSMTGNLPAVPRIAIAGLAMPAEQQAADALVSVGDEALKKAGVDEKFLTETKFGTLGQLARGEKGEAMGNLTTQIIIGAAFGAFHGDKPPVVEKFAKAVDALEAKGMNPAEAAAEIKKAATDPKAEPKVDEVKAFADSLDDIPQVREFLKSNNEQKPQESPKQPLPDTQQAGPEIPPPGEQIGSPGFNPARQPAKLGKTAPKAEQPDPIAGEKASSDANQRTVTVTPLKSPFEGLPKADLDSLAVALGVKSKDLFKMPLHSQQALVDAMFGGETAKSTQEVIYPNARVSESTVAQPEPAKIELGQSSEATPRANGQKITRIPISENGKEIAEFKGFQSGKTLHIDWLGATGAGAKDQWAKGSLGTTKMRDIFRQLADRYPDAEFLKYTPAEGRLRAGESRMIDLNAYRPKKLVPDKEMQSAINDAVQSGQSPDAIAEAISAGHAQAEKDEGGNGPAGKAKGFGQTKSVDRSATQAAAAEGGSVGSAGRTEPTPRMERLGHETTIAVQGSHPIPARYELRELRDVVASHGITDSGNFKNRKGEYPEGLQPRDYSNDESEQSKVKKYALELNPAQFINDDPNPTGGPTTITQNGNIAINGNGRQLALEEAARIGRFGKYKDHLEKKASQFGIDPASVRSMNQPVLVRVVDMDPKSETAAEFARRGNVSTTQGQSPERTAASLGGLISDSILNTLKLEGDMTFSEAVNESKGREFRDKLFDKLPDSERKKIFNNDRSLTDGGKEFVRNMLLSKMLPIQTIERLKDDRKGYARTLEGSIPQLIQLSRESVVDPRRSLAEALDYLTRNPRVKTIEDADNQLTQKSLFGGASDSVSPGARMMVDFILKHGNESKVFRTKLANFIEDTTGGTNNLFSDAKYDPIESAARNLGVEARKNAQFTTGESAKEQTPQDSLLWQMADRMEQHARETLKDIFGGEKMLSGFDPSLIVPLSEFIAAKIIKGGVTFKVYSQGMIQKFGDAIKPHLDEIWSKAQSIAHGNKPAEQAPLAEEAAKPKPQAAEPEKPIPPAGEPPVAEPKPEVPQDATAIKNATVAKERESRGIPAAMEADPVGHTFPEIADQVGRIAKTEPGKIDDLIQSLQKKPRAVNDLEDAMLLRRQVDLQNNYDRFNDQYQKAKETNDAEGQTIAGNELAAARAKLRELYDVNKSVGTETGRGLNARKMLMAKDYTLAKMTTDYELSIGRKMNPNDIEAVSKAFERIKQLESKIAELEKKRTETPPEPKATVEPKQQPFSRRTEAAKAEVDAAWDLLKKATKGRMFANPAFDPEVIGAAAGVAKAYIKLGVAKFSDFVESVQAKSGHTASEDEKKVLQMAWDRAQADLKKVELPPMTKEQKQTTAEYREAVKDWNKKLHENEKANDHAVVKGIRHVGNVADFLRAVMLGGDVPPMLRQGGFVTAGRPILSSKALGRSAKGFLSEAKAHEVLIDLTERENAKNGLYKRAMDLDVGDIHGQDEFLHSSWIKQVPGFSHLERWHSSYLTQLRADLFDAMTSSMSRSGRPDEAEAKIIGNAVNVFTGKGNLYSAEKAVGLLNKVFLAPKWVASRFQLAIGQPLWHGIYEHGLQPRARAAVAKEYARAFAGLGAMYSLAGLAIASGLMNATIEKDPRSSDFGEIKIGNTRINPLFGTSQAIRTMAQLISGQRKSTTSGKITEQPASETVGKELRNKLAPIPSAAITGTELARRDLGFSRKGPSVPYPQDWKSMATDYLTPLSLQDMYKACEDLGIPKGLTVGLLASFGAGVKVYGK